MGVLSAKAIDEFIPEGLATVAANVIIPRTSGSEEVLMVKDRREPPKWGLPGGGFEFQRDLDVVDTAWRETREETGVCIAVEKLRLIGVFFLMKSPGVVFLFEGQGNGRIRVRSDGDGKETQKIRFTSPEVLLAEGEEVYPAQEKLYQWWRWWLKNGREPIIHQLTSPP